LSLVGIIANPASGKDIAAGGLRSVFDNQEKVRIVRRVLLGLAAVEVGQICYMPDYFGIVERAVARIEIPAKVFPLQFKIQNSQEDSTRAAEIMARMGAACIVTLGGDGTNRQWSRAPRRFPSSRFPQAPTTCSRRWSREPLRGWRRPGGPRAGAALGKHTGHTRLEVVVDGQPLDLALVDAVVYDDVFIGSRAVWDMSKVHTVFLNRAEPASIACLHRRTAASRRSG